MNEWTPHLYLFFEILYYSKWIRTPYILTKSFFFLECPQDINIVYMVFKIQSFGIDRDGVPIMDYYFFCRVPLLCMKSVNLFSKGVCVFVACVSLKWLNFNIVHSYIFCFGWLMLNLNMCADEFNKEKSHCKSKWWNNDAKGIMHNWLPRKK